MEIQQINLLSDDKLINLIKEQFTDQENELFKLSYQLYVSSYNNQNDFIVNLDDIYKWIGFSRKCSAKRLLENNFKLNIDYNIVTGIASKCEIIFTTNLHKGGTNKEKILLTIDCFKSVCLLASTKKSKELYNYYIKIEKCIFRYLHDKLVEQTNKSILLQNQLTEKSNEIKLKDDIIISLQKQLLQYNLQEIKSIHIMYICSTDIENTYKINSTYSNYSNIKQCIESLQKLHTKNTLIEHVTITSNKPLLESVIYHILDKYRCSTNKDYFTVNLDYIKKIIDTANLIMNTIMLSYNSINDKDLLKIILIKLNVELKLINYVL